MSAPTMLYLEQKLPSFSKPSTNNDASSASSHPHPHPHSYTLPPKPHNQDYRLYSRFHVIEDICKEGSPSPSPSRSRSRHHDQEREDGHDDADLEISEESGVRIFASSYGPSKYCPELVI